MGDWARGADPRIAIQAIPMKQWVERLYGLNDDFTAPLPPPGSDPDGTKGSEWTRSYAPFVDHGFRAARMSPGGLNPIEAMHMKLARAREARGQTDPKLLKPNKEQREAIAKILRVPGDNIEPADRETLWRYRYSLRSDPHAVVKFVLTVDWSDVEEARQGRDLLDEWAPIGADSALKLLSDRFQGVDAVRRHAIRALDTFSNDELCWYLLQLVQAMRYEELPPIVTRLATQNEEGAEGGGGGGGGGGAAAEAGVRKSGGGSGREDSGAGGGERKSGGGGGGGGERKRGGAGVGGDGDGGALDGGGDDVGGMGVLLRRMSTVVPTSDEALERCPLVRLLARRATQSVELATLLHWYLQVETEDDKMGAHFSDILKIVHATMERSGGSLGRQVGESVDAQQNLIDRLRATLAHSIEKAKKTAQKVAKLRRALQPGGFAEDLRKINVVNPLDTSQRLTGVVVRKGVPQARMFASATYPMDVEWYVKPSGIRDEPSALPLGRDPSLSLGGSVEPDMLAAAAAAVAAGPRGRHDGEEKDTRRGSLEMHQERQLRDLHESWKPQETVHFIYKGGDDMRQDQLVIQMIALTDRLFKRVNLDLCLTPFKVISTSRDDGLMEFIDGAYAVSAVLGKHKGNLQAFFREHHPAPAPAKYGIDPNVMDTFIRSTAGYCVITFVLGIGDRHQENLMIKKTGHLIHIDFGWIFGRDPKPYPAPMRLLPEMVTAMGGPKSEDYAQFVRFCCQAYHIMRTNANLICNLLSLMSDAGIKDLSVEQDPATVIAKVRERLRLDLTDAASAEQYLIARLNESVTAIMPKLMDFAHAIAVRIRG